MQYKLVEIQKLRGHEMIETDNVQRVLKSFKDTGILNNPIIADKDSLVIIDGHHRLAAAKIMELKKLPVFVVDYFSENVKMKPRKKIPVKKEDVINRGLKNDPFPPKTTKHHVSGLRSINILIDELK